jgi:hypothetical protein
MATSAVRGRRSAVSRRATDETKASFKTTEMWTAVVVVAAILIASAVSDSLDDVRAWTLVTAVAVGYMLSRGLAKSGTKYTGGEDLLGGGDPIRGVDRD